MLDQFKALANQHPRVALFAAWLLVYAAMENYARVHNWVSSIEQIEASEYFGG
jgi:hypothetical protein